MLAILRVFDVFLYYPDVSSASLWYNERIFLHVYFSFGVFQI